MKFFKFLNPFRLRSFYHKKCTSDRHFFAVFTPTLERTVILDDSRPCQCGKKTVQDIYKEFEDSIKNAFKEY